MEEVTVTDEITGEKIRAEEASDLLKALKTKAELVIIHAYIAQLKASIVDFTGRADLAELSSVLDRAPFPLTSSFLKANGIFTLAIQKSLALRALTEVAEKFDRLRL